MDWQPPPLASRDALPANARRRERNRLVWGGAVLVGLALVGITVAAVRIAVHVGSPLVNSLTGPVLHAPLDRSMTLEAGQYIVFELTGHTSGGGGITVLRNGSPTLAPEAVTVIGPDGRAVATTGPGFGNETVTRDRDIYSAAVRFTLPTPGSYRVVITTTQPQDVIITPALLSGFSRIGGWVAVLLGSIVGFLAGMVLLGIGLLRPPGYAGAGRASAPPPGRAPGEVPGWVIGGVPGWVPEEVPAAALPGWYPDPQAPERIRFWDGRAWGPQPPPTTPRDG